MILATRKFMFMAQIMLLTIFLSKTQSKSLPILNIIGRSLSPRRLDWSLLVNYSKQLHLRTMKPAGLPPMGEQERTGVENVSLQLSVRLANKSIHKNNGLLVKNNVCLPSIS